MVWTTAPAPEGSKASVWELARRQHGVVTREQLLALGLTRRGIEHRTARGRLHFVGRGIYAVGRSELTQHGRWMAAVLAAGGPGVAALSCSSAAAFFGIGVQQAAGIEVTRLSVDPLRLKGIKLHRRPGLKSGWFILHEGIPVTSPVQTLIDLAARHDQRMVERFVNEADRIGLVRTDHLRRALDDHQGERGVARLRAILDRRTFRYTRTELERDFIPLATAAGLSLPRTSVYVNGHEVDFYFPSLDLVIETDGLTYHRTPSQQAKDLERDHDHSVAGTPHLRFSHAQIKFEPGSVVRTLRATASRLSVPIGSPHE
jgi:very-short-patch-repair endonuclease